MHEAHFLAFSVKTVNLGRFCALISSRFTAFPIYRVRLSFLQCTMLILWKDKFIVIEKSETLSVWPVLKSPTQLPFYAVYDMASV